LGASHCRDIDDMGIQFVSILWTQLSELWTENIWFQSWQNHGKLFMTDHIYICIYIYRFSSLDQTNPLHQSSPTIPATAVFCLRLRMRIFLLGKMMFFLYIVWPWDFWVPCYIFSMMCIILFTMKHVFWNMFNISISEVYRISQW
jgi:hypothetical protein